MKNEVALRVKVRQQRAILFATLVAGLMMVGAADAQVTAPAWVADLFDDGLAMALLVVAAAGAAFVGYRGALIAFGVAKKVLSKIGLG